jgi:hypothetical protein
MEVASLRQYLTGLYKIGALPADLKNPASRIQYQVPVGEGKLLNLDAKLSV